MRKHGLLNAVSYFARSRRIRLTSLITGNTRRTRGSFCRLSKGLPITLRMTGALAVSRSVTTRRVRGSGISVR